MNPHIILLFIYPLSFLFAAFLLKWILPRFKYKNVSIIIVLYILSNLMIYYYIEAGIYLGSPKEVSLNIFDVFKGLKLRQWLWIVIVPHIFTILYISAIMACFYLKSYLHSLMKQQSVA
jgi:hypothetical protein